MEIIEKSKLTKKQTCEILELNPGRYYSWKRRYKAQGMNGLKNHKSTPKSCPHTLLEEEKQALNNFIEYYNHQRSHQGIEYVTPRQKYTDKAEKKLKNENRIIKKPWREENESTGKEKHGQLN